MTSSIFTQPDLVSTDELLESFGISKPRGNAQINSVKTPRIFTNSIHNTGEINQYGPFKQRIIADSGITLNSSAPVTIVPNGISGGLFVDVIKNLQTNNTMVRPIITIATTNNTIYNVKLSISCGKLTTSDTAIFAKRFMIKNINGAVTVGSDIESSSIIDINLTGIDVTQTVSSLTVNINVIGLLASNINWIARAEILAQSF